MGAAPIGPGDFVRCINDGTGEIRPWEDGAAPTEGALYTVEQVAVNSLGRDIYILKEIKRGPWAIAVWGHPCGYWVERFVPVYRRDESLTARLLSDIPASAPASPEEVVA